MKKILLTLFVGFIGIISFCSALNIQYSSYQSVSIVKSSTYSSGHKIPANSLVCFYTSSSYNSCTWNNVSQNITYHDVLCVQNTGNSISTLNVSCTNTNTNNSLTLYWTTYNLFSSSCPSCPDCPSCGSCTGYNLNVVIPGVMNDTYNINSDINLYLGDNVSSSTVSFPNIYVSSTCQASPECPDGDFSGFSKFYVKNGEGNWNELSGTESYFVYIPEFLGYNYDYSNNGRDLDFTVGVATDTGYINNISAIQNSKPSQEDLNKLVSEVLPLFVPGLAVILLLYFIFRFIKKVF